MALYVGGNNLFDDTTLEVTGSRIPYTTFSQTGAHHLVGGFFTIPSAGIWHIDAGFRMGWRDNTGFCYASIAHSNSSGDRFTDAKFLTERIATESTDANHIAPCHWIIECGSGMTFPHRMYFFVYEPDRSYTTLFTQDDANGVATVQCIKLRPTTSTDSSPVQLDDDYA